MRQCFCVAAITCFGFANAIAGNAIQFAAVVTKRGVGTSLRDHLFDHLLNQDVYETSLSDATRIAEALWRAERLHDADLTATEAMLWLEKLFSGTCDLVTQYAVCLKARDISASWLRSTMCEGTELGSYDPVCIANSIRAPQAWKVP